MTEFESEFGADMHTGILSTGAITDHEVFMAWVNIGFTRDEALQLLISTKERISDQDFDMVMHKLHCEEEHP